MTPLQCKIIVAYCASNDRLAIETGQWSIIPILRNYKLCHVSLTMLVKTRHTVGWSVPSTTPIEMVSFHVLDAILASIAFGFPN